MCVPAPIVIRLASSFGHNRDFIDKVLNCYSLLRPYDALSPKSAYVADEIGKLVFDKIVFAGDYQWSRCRGVCADG